MAFTQADLDTIDRAIANGESEVEFPDGSRVRNQTIGDLQRRRSFISEQIAIATGKRRPRQVRMTVGKGA